MVRRIPDMARHELDATWTAWLEGEPPHHLGAMFVTRLLAWKLQELVYGGLSPTVKRRLETWAAAYRKDPDWTPVSVPMFPPGTMLVRIWRGNEYRVEVRAEGFRYEGVDYPTLSVIARQITGGRWSGPLFFGLRRRTKGEAT